MSNVLLINENKLKAFTAVHENVDSALLLPNIQIAQDIGLQYILGTKFLEHLKNQFSGGTQTLKEQELMDDYISPYLVHRAYYELLPQLYMRTMNKGIIIGETEQGKSTSVGDMKYLRNIQQNRYEFYAQRMMDFIKNNQSDFTLYYQYTSTDGMKPEKQNYFSGIHIPPGNRKLPNTDRPDISGGNMIINYENYDDCCD